jgi:hypothetical protein
MRIPALLAVALALASTAFTLPCLGLGPTASMPLARMVFCAAAMTLCSLKSRALRWR